MAAYSHLSGYNWAKPLRISGENRSYLLSSIPTFLGFSLDYEGLVLGQASSFALLRPLYS